MTAMEFITRAFGTALPNTIDPWLNSLLKGDYSVSISGFAMSDGVLLVTVKRWKRSEAPNYNFGQRAIPTESQPEEWKEPTINLSEDKV